MATGLASALDSILDLADGLDEPSAPMSWGPIPLHLHAGRQIQLGDIHRFLTPGTNAWGSLRVGILSSRDLPSSAIPAELDPRGRSDVAVYRDGDREAIASGPDGSLWVMRRGTASAIRWMANPDDLPVWERISPLRVAARWWSGVHGGASVHSGAVGDADGAVLLVGDGGAGKSTTALACLIGGLDVFGDDFHFVEPPGPNRPARVHAMYRLAKADDRTISLLPELEQRVIGVGAREKKLIELDELDEPRRPIDAICHVRQSPEGPTRFSPIARAHALRAMAPSTLFQVPLQEATTWSVMAESVRSVPTYQLDLGHPGDAPKAVTELLADARRRGP